MVILNAVTLLKVFVRLERFFLETLSHVGIWSSYASRSRLTSSFPIDTKGMFYMAVILLWICVCVWVHAWVQVPGKLSHPFRVGGIGSCELPEISTLNLMCVLHMITMQAKLLSHLSSPKEHILKRIIYKFLKMK